MKLLTSQKNQLFDYVSDSNYFSNQDFEIQEDFDTEHGESVARVVFKNSQFCFEISKQLNDEFGIRYTPGEGRAVLVDSYLPIESALACFPKWLKALKEEIMLEDKWEKLASQDVKLIFNSDFDNTKFNSDERALILAKIEQLKEALPTIGLLAKEQSVLVDKLDHLLDMTSSLNKYDWANLFIGTIIGIIIQLGVTQANAKALWNLIKSIFHGLLLS